MKFANSSLKSPDVLIGFLDLTNYGSLFRLEVAEDVAYTDSQNVIQTKDLAFVTTGHNKKALIIDISDISAPAIIKEIDLSDAAGSITNVLYNKEHKLLFVISGNKLYVYELKSLLDSNLQREPKRIGVYENDALLYAGSITADSNYLYIGSDKLMVIQYDPDYGMELVYKDEEFPDVNLPADHYYPTLGEKEIWIKVKDDSQCSILDTAELCLAKKQKYWKEFNTSNIDNSRTVRVWVKEVKEETPSGCTAYAKDKDNAIQNYSDMEIDKAKARFYIKCPSTVKEGKITIIFQREPSIKEPKEPPPAGSAKERMMQAYVDFEIRSNANVKFHEVRDGKAVYTYDDTDTPSVTDTNTGWFTSIYNWLFDTWDNEKKFDFVQEIFNQVAPRKRYSYSNFDSYSPVQKNDYELMDEDGIYDNYTYNAVLDFKMNFKFAVNRKAGPYNPDAPIGSRYSDNKGIDDTSPTFRKLMKDYGKRRVGGTSTTWLIEDNAPDAGSYLHKVIDKETLVGLNGYNPTDTEVSLITSTVTGNVVTSTGVYELYANVVRPFVNKMIEEGERYRNATGYQNTDGNWKPRTYSTDPAQTTSVSYSFGGKQTMQEYIDTVSKYKAPPNTPYPNGIPLGYRGDIDDNSGNIGATSNKKKWAGLYFKNPNTKVKEYSTNPNSPYYMKYWAGIDCSGFVQRTVEPAQNLNTIGNIKITIPLPSAADMNVKQTFINDRVYYVNLRNVADGIKKIHRGDLMEYRSRRTRGGIDHSSVVYSDRPSNCVDKDGKTTCTYEIIHAYGGEKADLDNDPTTPMTFTRKVVITPNNMRTSAGSFPTPTGFGRIKLWD